MIVIAVIVAAVGAFILSSVYYLALTPVERKVLGDRALDRGQPQAWQVFSELVRTAVVASTFAWIADQADRQGLLDAIVLALVIWVGYPVVLLAGSVTWEKVPPITAAIHAGDWLLKLVLIAVVLGLLH